MDDFLEFEEVACYDRIIDFEHNGTPYTLCFGYNYVAALDSAKKEVHLGAMAIGRMLRGDFKDLFAVL